MMDQTTDILVIGGGMAGASVAAELAGTARVILTEMESQPGYHTTGRSAAMYEPAYGPAPIRALTRASLGFFMDPPDGFGDGPLISPRATLFIAAEADLDRLAALQSEMEPGVLDPVGAEEMLHLNPLLRPGYAVAGALDRSGADIDVARLHQGYLRLLKAKGGQVLTRAEVTGLRREAGLWQVDTGAGRIAAPIVVNAAGAWADLVGALAGAEPIGLVPKRRTALTVAAPDCVDIAALPLTVDAPETFYLKPEAGRLLLSPANADPQVPSDAQPDEMDVALCIDRISRAFMLKVRRIESRWAGLRSFVADGNPVAGRSDRVDGFYWLAGQGGYGIQSAPALARLAAAQILEQAVPDDILSEGLHPVHLSPGRLHGAEQFAP